MPSLPYFFLCSCIVQFSRKSTDIIIPSRSGKPPVGDCCFVAHLQMNQHGGNPETEVIFLMFPRPSQFTPSQICCLHGYLFGLL